MPKFLEDKLKAEYGADSAIPYKVMNKIGAMHGNKETAKGRAMEAKHERDVGAPKQPGHGGMRHLGMAEASHRGNPGRKPFMRHGGS